MSNDDRSKIEESAETRWRAQSHGPPEDNAWGFFCYADAPPAIGGGFGSFTWFLSKDEMLDFIGNTIPYSPPGPASADWRFVAEETKKITESMKEGTLAINSGVSQLNETLKDFSQFEWMGTPEELFAGEHRYAARVRATFRGCDTDENSQENNGPISPEEKDAFCDFLIEYGI